MTKATVLRLFSILAAIVAAFSNPAWAQEDAAIHLNPVIDKLLQGKHVFGVSTADLSLQNARALARDPDIDYVYIDMEHNAMRFDQLEVFLAGLTDKYGILQRGNAQMQPAVFARFAPYGNENIQWVVKHGLDLGLMGVLINNIETPEQAEQIVQTMRFMPRRNSTIPEPRGVRGSDGNAPYVWGISDEEYERRADLWPLNPEGELLFLAMIETVAGVNNADAIAQVPGISGFYFGLGTDLSRSLGLPDREHPEVLASIRSVLAVCRERNLICGGTVNADNVADRLEDGYQFVNFGRADGGLNWRNEAARRAALSAGANR